jgi:hypothetical protein
MERDELEDVLLGVCDQHGLRLPARNQAEERPVVGVTRERADCLLGAIVREQLEGRPRGGAEAPLARRMSQRVHAMVID